jgi:hypothetical protein
VHELAHQTKYGATAGKHTPAVEGYRPSSDAHAHALKEDPDYVQVYSELRNVGGVGVKVAAHLRAGGAGLLKKDAMQRTFALAPDDLAAQAGCTPFSAPTG